MNLGSFIREVNSTCPLIATHINADPDALASVVLVDLILRERYGLRSTIFIPQGPSRLSKRALKALNLPVKVQEELTAEFDSVIVVDTSTSKLLGDLADKIMEKAVMVIDHHIPPGDLVSISKASLIREEIATVSLVLQLEEFSSISIPPNIATLAVLGIIYDSRRFSRATPVSLNTVARLMLDGANYENALKLFSMVEEDLSSRIAKLKGAQRASIVRFGSYLVTITHVGSHEALVARTLVSMGADLAFVIGGKDELRISSRARNSFVEKTGIDLGKFMRDLERYLEGKGGGHLTAGGFNGKGDPQEAMRVIMRLLEEALF